MPSAISVLVNPATNEQPILDFLKAAKIATYRREVFLEREDMRFVKVGKELTRVALKDNLHVDQAEDSACILIFNPDEKRLSLFLGKNGLKNTPVVRCDGDEVVEYTCQRLSEQQEEDAMMRGLLVGRTSYKQYHV
ncbi:MAG: hypothetical protein P4M13_10290 [Alphaproteobacteria bacterium]|nr:hypothetical protein [Alphaproteobacteria bacterium]